jgi:ribonuclease BN (tRNA processing enzyme)
MTRKIILFGSLVFVGLTAGAAYVVWFDYNPHGMSAALYIDPERSGPCTAIVVNSTPYLVDLGTGVVRRAAAARNKGVKALEPTNLKIAFITHLHSA